MLTIVLIVLIVLFLVGGGIGYRGSNRSLGHGGIGIGTVLIIVLVVMLLTGRL